MTRLHEIGTIFVQQGNLKPALRAVLKAAIAITKADFGNVQLLDPTTGALRIIAQSGFAQWWVDFWNKEACRQGVCGVALQRGERVIVEDLEKSAFMAGTPALEIQRRAGVRAVQSTPLVTRSGKIVGMFSTHYKRPHRPEERVLRLLDMLARHAADIIERSQYEAALQQSEQRFRLVVSSTPDHILMQDLELRYTFIVNPQLGLAVKDIIGRTDYDLLPRDDAERLTAIKRQVLESGKPVQVELTLPSTRSPQHIFEGSYVPRLDSSGRVDGLIGYFRDVSERRRAEQALAQARAELESKVEERTAELARTVRLVEAERRRFRDVLDRLPAYLVLRSADDRPSYANRFYQERFGNTPGWHGTPPVNQQAFPHEDALCHQTVKTAQLHRWEGTGPDGRIYEIYNAPFTDIDGAELILEVGLDITERRRVEREQQILREEISRISRITTAGQLAASLAHELNQPLGAIVCNTQAIQNYLAQGGLDQSEIQGALCDIEADGKRAGGIIHQLRKLYQKSAQANELLQFNDLLTRTLDLLRSEFVQRDIAYEVDLDPSLPEIMANEVQLQQVVLNLVTNAVQAMTSQPSGVRRLRLRTTRIGANSLQTSIQDSGPGIQPEQFARLFEPFYTTKADGMGMGLPISQTIVEAHRGQLWAENNADGGATFHFTLPVEGKGIS